MWGKRGFAWLWCQGALPTDINYRALLTSALGETHGNQQGQMQSPRHVGDKLPAAMPVQGADLLVSCYSPLLRSFGPHGQHCIHSGMLSRRQTSFNWGRAGKSQDGQCGSVCSVSWSCETRVCSAEERKGLWTHKSSPQSLLDADQEADPGSLQRWRVGEQKVTDLGWNKWHSEWLQGDNFSPWGQWSSGTGWQRGRALSFHRSLKDWISPWATQFDLTLSNTWDLPRSLFHLNSFVILLMAQGEKKSPWDF